MALKDYLEDYDDDQLKDVVNHGCVSGCVGSLIYYTDTNKAYDECEDEIWDMLDEEYQEFGHQNIVEFIGSFNGANNVGSLEQFKNLLIWYAVEETARKILNEKGVEV